MKLYTTEIESWWYPKENDTKGYFYKVVVRDDLTGEVVAEGPIRDNRLDAKQDKQELRSGKLHIKDWQ